MDTMSAATNRSGFNQSSTQEMKGGGVRSAGRKETCSIFNSLSVGNTRRERWWHCTIRRPQNYLSNWNSFEFSTSKLHRLIFTMGFVIGNASVLLSKFHGSNLSTLTAIFTVILFDPLTNEKQPAFINNGLSTPCLHSQSTETSKTRST